MTPQQMQTIEECAGLSAAGRIQFKDVITRLADAGVERYHADYCRMGTTYYTAVGQSCTVPMAFPAHPIADSFSVARLEAAVRQAQRGELIYPQFSREAAAAGCVGYFVQITGKCVQYFGRRGELHTEWFPDAPRPH